MARKKSNNAARPGSQVYTSPATAGAVQSKSARRRARQRQQRGGSMAPLNMGRSIATSIPQMSRRGMAFTVTHRELVQDVLGRQSFTTVNSLVINPGLSASFPWLSAIANRFESYVFRSLRIIYESCLPATAPGVVYLAVDYDPSDAAPSSKMHMMSFSNAVRAPAWQSMFIDCPPSDLNKMVRERYTRDRVLPANQDNKTYDVGNLYVSVDGFLADGLCGELYVEYTIDLFTPQVVTEEELAESASLVANGVNVTRLTPLAQAEKFGGLPVTVVNENRLRFDKAGEYLLELRATGAGMNGTNPTIVDDSPSVEHKITLAGIVNAAASLASYVVQVNAKNDGDTIGLDFTPSGNQLTSLVSRIAPYAYSI